MGWQRMGLLLLFAAGALLLALGASASPDPPHVDGGSVEFVGNWTVDALDDLLYVNETIVLDGNLTVEQGGNLTLENCTLVMNCTTDGGCGIDVRGGGGLYVNRSSEVRYGPAQHNFSWTVQLGGHVEVVGSVVAGAGTGPTDPGFVLRSGGNVVSNSTLTDCWCAITGTGARDTVSDVVISRCHIGLNWSGADAVLYNISIDHCTREAIRLDGAVRVSVVNLTATLCDTAVTAGPSCSGITIATSVIDECTVGINVTCDGIVIDRLDAFCHGTAILLQGSRATVNNVSAHSRGDFSQVAEVGILIEGPASDISLYQVDLAAYRDALMVTGAVQRLTVVDLGVVTVYDGAIALTGPVGGPSPSHVTLLDLDLYLLDGVPYGVYARGVDDLSIGTVSFTGKPEVGVLLEGCSHVRMADLAIGAVQRVASVDGEGSAEDVAIVDSRLDGGLYGVWLADLSGVTISNLTISGSSLDCVLATRVEGLRIDRCTIKDGSRLAVEAFDSPNATIEGSVMSSTPYIVHLSDCRNATVRQSFLMDADVGLSLLRCDGAAISNVSASDTIIGFRLNATTASDVYRCDVDSAVDAFLLEGGTDGCALRDCFVSQSTTGVRITGGSRGNSVAGLMLATCDAGLLADGAGDGNVLRSAAMSDLDVGVEATGGTDLVVEEGSFIDCTVAMRTDAGSRLDWTVTGASALVNSSAMMHGLIAVDGGASLNVTGSDVTFLSDLEDSTGILAIDGSTLRLTKGTAFAFSGSGRPYTVNSSGALEVSACTFTGGGYDGSGPAVAALQARGTASSIASSEFRDCYGAIDLWGSYQTVDSCSFDNDRTGVLLYGCTQPIITGCTFHLSNGALGIGASFKGTMVLRSTLIEGVGRSDQALQTMRGTSSGAVLSMRNVTFRCRVVDSFIWDSHEGSTLAEDCILDGVIANFRPMSDGDPQPTSVRLLRLSVNNSLIMCSPKAFIVDSCAFNRSALDIFSSPQGGLVTNCTFLGTPRGIPALLLGDGPYITCSGLRIHHPEVGISVVDGEVTAIDCLVDNATISAVEVNGSLVSMDRCELRSVAGNGSRAWGVGAHLEMRNCSIDAAPDRTGCDVSATQSAEAFLLNTTFDKSSIISTTGGRIEVLWYATFELRLPWGGLLPVPTVFSLTDAIGYEVVNTSGPLGTFQLYEFVDENDVRTYLTPHEIVVEHAGLGVNYTGEVTFDHSQHVAIDLVDVQPPTARAGPDQRVPEDSVVSLDGRSSTDNDPGLLVHGRFVWSFDEYGTAIVLTGTLVDYVFSVPGDFDITLTVTDRAGNVGRDYIVVQVVDVTPPVIRFGGNATVDEDVPSIFDASATTDNDPSFDTMQGQFVWQFDLVDGPLFVEGATVSVKFDRPGNYTATLTAFDLAGNHETAQFWVHVLDRTPPSIGGVHDITVYQETSGLLDASSSFDNVGIVTFEWTVTYGDETAQLEGATPAYTFSRLGDYRVTLTLRDAAGNENSTTVTITYDDVPVLVVPGNAVGMVGELLAVPVRVQDTFHTGLTFRIASGPVEASVVGDPSNATFRWTPVLGDENMSITFDIEVYDGYVGSLGRLTVWVNRAHGTGNHAPVITSSPPLGARRSTPYIYSVKASDPDGDRLGYTLEAGPAGMTVSTEGMISWDPPYDAGDILLAVRLAVTDGRDVTRQEWQVRFREPKNEAPQILFSFSSLEVRVREEFTVDLSVYVPDPVAKQVDPDDINRALKWDVAYNSSLVALLSHDGLVFRFKALDTPADLDLTFTVTDPSGASDSRGMRLTISPMPKVPVEETPWYWIAIALIVIGACLTAGGWALSSKRSRQLAAREAEEEASEVAAEEGGEGGWGAGEGTGAPGEGMALAGPSLAGPATAGEEEQGLEEDLDDLLAEVGAFEEVEAAPPVAPAAPAAPPVTVPTATTAAIAATAAATATRAPPAARGPPEAEVAVPPTTAPRPFVVDGVAVIGAGGRLLASTGRLEDTLAPVQEAVSGLLASGASSSDTTLEVDGRRVIAAVLGGLGIVCVIRGKEDDQLRPQLMELLAKLPSDPRKEAAVAVVGELVSSTAARADVVKGAWTAHIRAAAGFKGSSVALGVLLRNDTDATMHNVRIELGYDHDALRIGAVRPKLLVSQDRVSVGNVAPGKSLELEVSFDAELCLSSQALVTASYTDPEGRRVVVPARPARVDVRPPKLRPASALPDKGLVGMATGGLAHSGRRAFTHALDAPRGDFHDIAVRKAKEAGLALARELDEPELMRKETWLLGEGSGGPPSKVLVRISTHGTDHMLELFVASDDAASVVGLLGHLSMELLDSVRSGMPGVAFDRQRDPRLLSDLEIWPTLLEYAVEGD